MPGTAPTANKQPASVFGEQLSCGLENGSQEGAKVEAEPGAGTRRNDGYFAAGLQREIEVQDTF